MTWSRNKLTGCTIRPSISAEQTLRAPKGQTVATIKTGAKSVSLATKSDGTYRAQLEAGRTYRLSFS